MGMARSKDELIIEHLERENRKLRDELSRAQGGQGAEPVAWRVSHPERTWAVYDKYPDWAEGDFEIAPLYTQPQPAQQGSVPEGWRIRFTDGELRIDTPDDAHFQFARNNSAPNHWIPNMLYDLGSALLSTPTTPQADGWVRCEDRLPTEADADFRDDVWVNDKAMRNPKYQQCLARWNTVKDIADYTHWKPTGLKRPQPPKEGEGDE